VVQGPHRPAGWTDQLLAHAPAFRDEAAAFGLRYGWSQAVHDGLGVRGILDLARAAPPLRSAELLDTQAALEVLAYSAHRLVVTALRTQWARAVAEPLTGREIEVLRWAADGKTAQDTAEILNVKLSTARFRIDNAVRKLGAENIAAAVFRALVMGALHGLPEPATHAIRSAASPP
jgi:DNA-binding CsgD family transcriptional regulator